MSPNEDNPTAAADPATVHPNGYAQNMAELQDLQARYLGMAGSPHMCFENGLNLMRCAIFTLCQEGLSERDVAAAVSTLGIAELMIEMGYSRHLCRG